MQPFSEMSVEQRGLALLRTMVELGDAAVRGDPVAKPYLDADAIRITDGKPRFHKERFLSLLVKQMLHGDD